MPRILLVDDDAALREVIATCLVRAGHVVIQAEDGRQGAERFRAEPADLVITDLIMPNRDGIELITELRREWPELPIIAMTGVGRSALYLGIAAKLGAQRTLDKPFSAELLLRVIDELLGPRPKPPAGR